jgi:acyl carrier protein
MQGSRKDIFLLPLHLSFLYLRNRRFLAMSDSTSNRQIIAILQSIIAEKIKPGLEIRNIESTSPLLEGGLGLDSIMVVDLIVATEQQFAFNFAEDDLSLDSFASLEALARVIARHVTTPPAAAHLSPA